MKLRAKTSITILSLVALPVSIWAQESVLPQAFEVYGGTVGVIDAIQVTGANKTRVFASTDSANSVFYADVDYSSATPFGTNFIFRVVPDMDANANYGTPTWLAAHQQSGKIFVGTSSGLVSCTTTSGSLTTPISKAVSFVLIQGSRLFAVSDAVDEFIARTLYYGSLDPNGNLTSASLATNFYGRSVTLAISPVNNKVYVLCTFQTNSVLLKSSENYDAFSSATTFSNIPTTNVTLQSVGQVAVGPDGRLFLGGGNGCTVAWSDDDVGSWTNLVLSSGLGSSGKLNIVCNGPSNAYEVYFGTAVSSNKGVLGSWMPLPRPGGFQPPATHVGGGSTKLDPLSSNVIYFTTDKGIGGSTNAGVDIMELNNGLLAFQINSIDALPSKSVAWIGSKAGMRRATNFNTTPVWTDGDFIDAIVYSVAIDSDDTTGMTGYAGSCRLFKTTTGGGSNESSWIQVFSWTNYNLTDGEIKSVKAKGNFVALGYYSYSTTSPSGGVYVSTDSGSNWTAAITKVDVNKLIIRDEGGASVIYAAISKSKSGDQGGIYRVGSSVDLDMTNEVNIRDMAEDSASGIYASGTLPDAVNTARHYVVAYYRDTNSTWNMLTTNGLPGDFSDGEVLGRDVGPVITVGKDSATNDVPVLAAMRTLYYLPYGGTSWVTITNYPNGTQIKTLFYDELMVGTTIGLYGQGLNAVPADSVVALMPLAGDFDGDQLADPALYNTNGTWKIKLSGSGYALASLTGFLGGSGYSAVAGDFDGDRLADPAVYQASTGTWKIKLSSSGYAILPLENFLGGADYAGYTALAGDFDGDGLADPAIYGAASGSWIVKLSTAGYATITKHDFLGWSGFTGVAADFDGDGKADPTIYYASTGYWIILLSRSGYLAAVLEPGFLGSTGYTSLAADFDGDHYADPAVAETSTGHWQIKLSGGGYILLDLPNFLGE